MDRIKSSVTSSINYIMKILWYNPSIFIIDSASSPVFWQKIGEIKALGK
jgi:hypothetical protein